MKKFISYCFLTLFLFSFHNTLVAKETVKVVINTHIGEIILELYPDKAPVSVENFLKYVDADLYKNASFYRVVRMDNQKQNKYKIEVIQGGRAIEDSALAPITHETTKQTGILHKDGVISMARDAPGSATSEFFICVNDQPELDFGGKRNPDGQGFAAFGKVIKGMDIVHNIQGAQTIKPKGAKLEYTSGQILTNPTVIHNITRYSR